MDLSTSMVHTNDFSLSISYTSSDHKQILIIICNTIEWKNMYCTASYNRPRACKLLVSLLIGEKGLQADKNSKQTATPSGKEEL